MECPQNELSTIECSNNVTISKLSTRNSITKDFPPKEAGKNNANSTLTSPQTIRKAYKDWNEKWEIVSPSNP